MLVVSLVVSLFLLFTLYSLLIFFLSEVGRPFLRHDVLFCEIRLILEASSTVSASLGLGRIQRLFDKFGCCWLLFFLVRFRLLLLLSVVVVVVVVVFVVSSVIVVSSVVVVIATIVVILIDLHFPALACTSPLIVV